MPILLGRQQHSHRPCVLQTERCGDSPASPLVYQERRVKFLRENNRFALSLVQPETQTLDGGSVVDRLDAQLWSLFQRQGAGEVRISHYFVRDGRRDNNFVIQFLQQV